MLYNYIYLKKRNMHVFRVHVFYIMARLFKKSYTCTCSSYSSPRSYSTVFEEIWCKGVKYFSTMINTGKQHLCELQLLYILIFKKFIHILHSRVISLWMKWYGITSDFYVQSIAWSFLNIRESLKRENGM